MKLLQLTVSYDNIYCGVKYKDGVNDGKQYRTVNLWQDIIVKFSITLSYNRVEISAIFALMLF